MSQPKFDFGFPFEPLLRLSFVQEILESCGVIRPAPCYNTLKERCEDGTLEGKMTPSGWLVTERSLRAYIHSLQPDDIREKFPLAEVERRTDARAPSLRRTG